jgi:predicted outer membrane protein
MARIFSRVSGLMVVGAAMMFVVPPVSAQNRPVGPDQQLVTRLHQLGVDEIGMAQMGEARGGRPAVRAFAATVRRDHQKGDQQLLAYARRKNMDLTAVALPGGVPAQDALAMAPVTNSTQKEFDYAFVSRMVADHQASIDAATAAERLARDPELKALIDNQLRVMSEHLVSAQALLAQIPAPPPRVVQLPAYPEGASRTRTGADEPPAQAVQQLSPVRPALPTP